MSGDCADGELRNSVSSSALVYLHTSTHGNTFFMSTNVVVIGAGVIGLTTALLLQKKGYCVTVVAKYVPGDMNIEYTSPYSGKWMLLTSLPEDIAVLVAKPMYRRSLENNVT
jgi:hypothetical protein